RGMKEAEMEIIAGLIVDVLRNHRDDSVVRRTKDKVLELCNAFPIYNNC
ncbi:MAG: glycine hydroxymethyltransferase, partial [Thermodesulfobacteriota bacterium]|nr:glycine hydroxymethyltransferase [Thermodesulfobacteriota bacterium]